MTLLTWAADHRDDALRLLTVHGRLDPETIAAYADRWNWFSLSTNQKLGWDETLIDRFLNRWDFAPLSDNPALPWSTGLLERYLTRWDWARLSRNRQIEWTAELLAKYGDRLDFKALTRYARVPFTLELIRKFEDRWDWGSDTAAINDSNLNNARFPYTAEVLRTFADRFDWSNLSAPRDHQRFVITPELLEEHLARWNFKALSANPLLPWTEALIARYETRWDWAVLSQGANRFRWPQTVIERFSRRFDFRAASVGAGSWGYDNIDWSQGLLARFADRWDFAELSRCARIAFDVELLERYADRWNWSGLSRNPAVPWTAELVARFAPKIDFAALSANPRPFWTVELLDRYAKKLRWNPSNSGSLRSNPGLPWSIELYERYSEKWGREFVPQTPEKKPVPFAAELLTKTNSRGVAKELSSWEGLPWSRSLLEKHEDDWDWGALARNRAVPWSAELVDRFAGAVPLNTLFDSHPNASAAATILARPQLLTVAFGALKGPPPPPPAVHGGRLTRALEGISAWMKGHGAPALRPPVQAAALGQAERRLGSKLPEELLELLRFCDGAPGFFGGADLLGLEGVVGAWLALEPNAEPSEPEPGPMRTRISFSRGWFPFVAFGTGDYLCVDLDPGSAGTSGQIIKFTHDDQHGPVQAPSLTALWEAIGKDLKAGRYTFADGEWGPGENDFWFKPSRGQKTKDSAAPKKKEKAVAKKPPKAKKKPKPLKKKARR